MSVSKVAYVMNVCMYVCVHVCTYVLGVIHISIPYCNASLIACMHLLLCACVCVLARESLY